MSDSNLPFDALIVVSFGGPEGPDEVMPFLENVLRGRNVPRERMLEVAEHYQRFGGVSPLNEQNRALIAALVAELNRRGPNLPVYWGNRNWHPLLPDAVRQMADDGVKRALAFVTSAHSSYSSCRQYLENIEHARREVGEHAPRIEKLRPFYNHPGFIEPMIERARAAVEKIPEGRRSDCPLVFTAHSIPCSMAAVCQYAGQLEEASRLVVQGLGRGEDSPWRLVYQSRSGPPSQPWLEPDVCDHLRQLKDEGRQDAVVVPIGFISDHLEVIYDLDVEAAELCGEIGLNMVRSATVGTHPRFVGMIRELMEEHIQLPQECAADCCPKG